MSDIDRLNVACELLDRSLRLYYDGDSYFASLHLAGAAEEILGAYVQRAGGTSSFESLKRGAVRLSAFLANDGIASEPKVIGDLMNLAKNQTKHGHGVVSFDAAEESRKLLDRAVTNYYFLLSYHPLEETALIRRFNEGLVGA